MIDHVTTSRLPSASSITALKGRTNSLEPSTVAETATDNGGCKAMLSGIILSVNCCGCCTVQNAISEGFDVSIIYSRASMKSCA